MHDPKPRAVSDVCLTEKSAATGVGVGVCFPGCSSCRRIKESEAGLTGGDPVGIVDVVKCQLQISVPLGSLLSSDISVGHSCQFGLQLQLPLHKGLFTWSLVFKTQSLLLSKRQVKSSNL